MKKVISLLLVLMLCSAFAACSRNVSTGNSDYDYIISLLDRGEYDMAIQVIEMLRSNSSEEPTKNTNQRTERTERTERTGGLNCKRQNLLNMSS